MPPGECRDSGDLSPHPHRLETCPEPGTSAGGSVGTGFDWCGRWGSSADGCRSRPHYTVGCGGRSPGEQRLLIPPRPRSGCTGPRTFHIWDPANPAPPSPHCIIVIDPAATFPHQDKVLLRRAHDPHQVCVCRPSPATHLAPLTGDNPVVDPRRLIPTDLARDDFNLCWKRERKGS